MVKHCPICNRSSDEIGFVGEFCRSCASERLAERLPNEVDVYICKSCSMVRTKSGLKPHDGRGLESIIAARLSPYTVHLIDYKDDSARIEVSDRGNELVSEKRISLLCNKILCERCYKRAGGYYEATLQLRGTEKRSESFLRRVAKYLERRGEFISRIERVKNGYDLYVSSKRLAGDFISREGLSAKASYTHHGIKNGKKVYRNTYAIRL